MSMDLILSADDLAFREEIRAFIGADSLGYWRGKYIAIS